MNPMTIYFVCAVTFPADQPAPMSITTSDARMMLSMETQVGQVNVKCTRQQSFTGKLNLMCQNADGSICWEEGEPPK